MKANQSFPRLFGTMQFIGISVLLPLGATAQWFPAGPPSVIASEFITTGGITYFRLVGQLPSGLCCQRIAGYAVSRYDTNLTQTIQRETWGGACVQVFCQPWTEEWVSVLGALSPGNYRLTLTASAPGSPQPQIWATCSFSVPTNSAPTLTVSPGANGSQLLIEVAGVSNARYVLESSADRANWTAIKTNLGAPVTFSVGLTNGAQRFYRAVVLPAESRRLQ